MQSKIAAQTSQSSIHMIQAFKKGFIEFKKSLGCNKKCIIPCCLLKKSDQAGLNRRPLNLQSNALPLSYSRICFLFTPNLFEYSLNAFKKDDGYLIATNSQGKQVELLPDGNTFNFLEGLISKKLLLACSNTQVR